MKITSISARICNAELRNWIFVKVETGEPQADIDRDGRVLADARSAVGPAVDIMVAWYDDAVNWPIERRPGRWDRPERPGLGIEVDEGVIAAHPFAPDILQTRDAVLPEGTVVDW